MLNSCPSVASLLIHAAPTRPGRARGKLADGGSNRSSHSLQQRSSQALLLTTFGPPEPRHTTARASRRPFSAAFQPRCRSQHPEAEQPPSAPKAARQDGGGEAGAATLDRARLGSGKLPSTGPSGTKRE